MTNWRVKTPAISADKCKAPAYLNWKTFSEQEGRRQRDIRNVIDRGSEKTGPGKVRRSLKKKKRASIFGHHIKIWQLSFFVKILLIHSKILNRVISPGILTKGKISK